jgi:hypothetical protein
MGEWGRLTERVALVSHLHELGLGRRAAASGSLDDRFIIAENADARYADELACASWSADLAGTLHFDSVRRRVPEADCRNQAGTLKTLRAGVKRRVLFFVRDSVAIVTLAPDSCHCASFGNLANTKEPVYDTPVIAIDNSTDSYAGSLYIVLYNWSGEQMRVEMVTSRNRGKS